MGPGMVMMPIVQALSRLGKTAIAEAILGYTVSTKSVRLNSKTWSQKNKQKAVFALYKIKFNSVQR